MTTRATMETPVETNESNNDQSVTYVVIDSRFGPQAAGTKSACLAFIQDQLGEQSEKEALVNPGGLCLKKVKQL